MLKVKKQRQKEGGRWALQVSQSAKYGGRRQVGSKRSNSTQHHKRGLQVSLDNCDDVLCFLQDFGVLVCKEHHTAVVNLDTHLLQHHSVPAATRKQVVQRFSCFTPVDPAEIELPDQPAQPIEELGKPLDGLQCKTCGSTTVSKDAMRMHCKKSPASLDRR